MIVSRSGISEEDNGRRGTAAPSAHSVAGWSNGDMRVGRIYRWRNHSGFLELVVAKQSADRLLLFCGYVEPLRGGPATGSPTGRSLRGH